MGAVALIKSHSNKFTVPWSNGNDSSLSKRRSGFDSPWDRHSLTLSANWLGNWVLIPEMTSSNLARVTIKFMRMNAKRTSTVTFNHVLVDSSSTILTKFAVDADVVKSFVGIHRRETGVT